MADATITNTSTTTKAKKPRKSDVKTKPVAKTAGIDAVKVETADATTSANRVEAKSRFNAALDEAKAGAAALKAEATDKVDGYKLQARDKSNDWATDAKVYGDQAKVKAGELAVDGKTKASDAISSLGKTIADNAEYVDDKLGAKYGDYARTASRKLQETSAKLDNKSVEELGDDARQFVRKSPGTAIGIAAVAGFLISRLFKSSK